MSFHLLSLPAADAERLAYAEGFTDTAQLFARLADMQKALGDATAEIVSLREALEELVAEADFPVGWDGHANPNTHGFQLARAALKRGEGLES